MQTLNRVPLFRNFFLREENCRRVKDPLIQTGRLREEGGRGVALGTLAAHDCGASGGALPQDQQPACLQGPCLPARVPSSHQHGFTTVLQVDRAGASGPMRVGRGACAAITRVCRGQSDPFELVSWLLNTLDRKLQRHGKSIVADTFQGRMRVKTKKIPPTEDMQRVAGISIDPNGPEYQGAQLPLHRGGRGGGARLACGSSRGADSPPGCREGRGAPLYAAGPRCAAATPVSGRAHPAGPGCSPLQGTRAALTGDANTCDAAAAAGAALRASEQV